MKQQTLDPLANTHWHLAHEDEDVLVIQHHHAQPPEVPEPQDWVQRMCQPLRTLSNVVAIGAKRLDKQGKLFSMGEYIIHPKSFHALGQGLDATAFRFAVEVDAITSGVLAIKRSAFEQADGYKRLQGQLGAIQLCLALRQDGGRCICIPQVVVVDEHVPAPTPDESQAFIKHWGFDWFCADLQAVQQQHAGTGLLWQVRYHTEAMPFEKYEHRPAMHWQAYQTAESYQQRADFLAQCACKLCPTGHILDLGCGDGLFAHLFAKQGPQVTGIDPELSAITQARQQTQSQTYPQTQPTFVHGNATTDTIVGQRYDLVTMFDVIEHLPNPVRVLKQVERLIKPSGSLLISTPAWQHGHWSDPVYHVAEYTMDQLTSQIKHATGMAITHAGQIKGVYRDLVVSAIKS